jgi:hypothetical protein
MCQGSALKVFHVHRVVNVGDGVLRERLRWWSDYIACNSEHPNKICNIKTSKKILGVVRCQEGLPDAGVHILDGKGSPSGGKP